MPARPGRRVTCLLFGHVERGDDWCAGLCKGHGSSVRGRLIGPLAASYWEGPVPGRRGPAGYGPGVARAGLVEDRTMEPWREAPLA